MSPRVACVIPVYNHASRVGSVLEQALGLALPVVVVDDGSTDGTADVLAQYPEIVLVRHPENHGKGAALQSGFRAALPLADWAVTLDADGQHDPGDVAQLVAAIPRQGVAIVVGCRSGMRGQRAPWSSRFGRQFSNFWVWAGGGGWHRDTQSGFRAYPLPATLRLEPRARRFQYEVEILVRAGWSGVPVLEVPVSVVYQERISHFRPWVDFWRNASTFTRLIGQRLVVPRRFRATPGDLTRD